MSKAEQDSVGVCVCGVGVSWLRVRESLISGFINIEMNCEIFDRSCEIKS